MKQFLAWTVLLLVAASASAQTAAAKRRPQAKRRAAAPAAVTADDVKALREALAAQQQQMAAQQQQMQQLQQQLQQVQQQLQQTQTAATAAESKLEQFQSSSSEQQRMYKSLEANVNDIKANATSMAATTQEQQKKVSAVAGLVKTIRWTGDIRVRQEDFFLPGQNPRVRQRIRLRLGIEGQLGQDFIGGIGLASGTLADSTSTNETLTNFFERKIIGFDRGYITYNPTAHKWLSLTGGKFAYTWQRTNQTFDPDLNPEGFSEKLSFDVKNSPLKNFTFTGMQLLFNENSATKFGTSGIDSYAVGGQVLAKVGLGKRWTMTPSYSLLNWHNANVILNAPAVNGGTFPVSGTSNIVCAPVTALGAAPACSFAVTPFAPNGMTNAYAITARASNGNLTREFLSKFLYSDLILENTIDTGHARWPWRVLLEYENNLRAVAPGPGRSPQSHMYLVETNLGQTKNKGDLLFGYAWVRQEQDSTIASFTESDQRIPTNVLQHRVYAQHKVHPKAVLAYTLWVGRVLDTSLFAATANPFGAPDTLQTGFLAPGVFPGQHDKYLKRMQFDLIYTF